MVHIKNEINELETINTQINRDIRYFSSKPGGFRIFDQLEQEMRNGETATNEKIQLRRFMKDIEAKHTLLNEYKLQEKKSLKLSILANEAFINKKK